MSRSQPTELKQNPLPDDFWHGETETLFEVLFPLFTKMAVDAAREAFNELAGQVDIGVSWDVFNQIAVEWAREHTAEVVKQISKTSMAGFLEKFEPWLQSGKPLKDLIDDLEPYYGEVRAEMVAVTEVTRAYALGNLSMWKNTGMVTGFRWNTAEDNLVCEICEPLDQKTFGLDEDAPPAHVRCRCWITPTLEE